MPETIIGFKEFERKLKELELCQQREVLTKAAKAGGMIVLEDAKRLAPRAPDSDNKLAEGMTMRVKASESDANEVSVDVGPGKKQFYGFFQEFGTATQAPQPFLAPALENNRDKITKVMQETMIDAIKKVAG
jgi:HK97 gp10 family phage protein